VSRSFKTQAHVAVARTEEELSAHVELDVTIGPGDSVRLLGPPIRVGFGERTTFTRTAIVRRASPLERAWTRVAGHFALTELYEVSFSRRSLP
jgi:hypothetical protein